LISARNVIPAQAGMFGLLARCSKRRNCRYVAAKARIEGAIAHAWYTKALSSLNSRDDG
jgi:hypothetical protein